MIMATQSPTWRTRPTASTGPRRRRDRRAVGLLDGRPQRQPGQSGGEPVRPGQYGHHARRGGGRRGVDAADLGMGVRRPQKGGMQHTGLALVVGIEARAGDEALVLEPPHRLAHAEFRQRIGGVSDIRRKRFDLGLHAVFR